MVADSVVTREDIRSDFIQLGLFILTVFAALGVPVIALVLARLIASRKHPFRILKYSGDAYILAFATTSP